MPGRNGPPSDESCFRRWSKRVDQCAAARARAGVDHHAGGLVHHDEVRVFVQELDGDFLGSGGERRAGEDFDFDDFAGGEAMRAAR